MVETTPASRRERLLSALRSPRGSYAAERASHLSGIPRSTLYEWRRSDVWHPDYSMESPVAWSYRDLVYVRLLAWLRQNGMERYRASSHVGLLRDAIEGGERIQVVWGDNRIILVDDEPLNRFGGENVFPHPDFLSLMESFELTQPIEELGRGSLWGPDLVEPSSYTYISPWVMAGDPCIANTRIPTSSLYALRTQRGLSVERIVALYPGLREEMVDDACDLEGRLRHQQAA